MRRGFTLIEIAIGITIISLMVGLAIPKLVATRERVHVDLATSRLQTMWNAQRFYWIEHGAFADDLDALGAAGLIDKAFAKHDTSFDYEIRGDRNSFTASAKRTGSGWSGTLTIDETGTVAGFVTNREGRRVLP